MPGKVFINYRREDTASQALNLAQYLERVFGARNIFIDIDRIRAGQNFRTVLDDRLAACDVMLAVIGPSWLEVRAENGQRRLDDPEDWVRLEIGRALARGIAVIPVLVAGAAIPKKEDLPEDLRPLLNHQAAAVSTNSFRDNMTGLVRDIRTIQRRTPWGMIAAAAVILVIAGGVAVNPFGLDLRFWQSSSTALVLTSNGEDQRAQEARRAELAVQEARLTAERVQREEAAKRSVEETARKTVEEVMRKAAAEAARKAAEDTARRSAEDEWRRQQDSQRQAELARREREAADARLQAERILRDAERQREAVENAGRIAREAQEAEQRLRESQQVAILQPPRQQATCGWYAIAFCSQASDPAQTARNRFGGYVINTSDTVSYPNFRAGWYCVVEGPTTKEAATSVMQRMKASGSSTAYIKNAC